MAGRSLPLIFFQKKNPLHYKTASKNSKNINLKTPLVTGASGTASKNRLTNSLFFLNKDGEFLVDQYDKKFLLAFGEFIPGDRWFPVLRKYFLGSHRGFAAGKEYAAVRQVKDTILGLQICYEGLREALSRKLAQKGAQILFNATNDSWFGKSSQPYQHLYMTLARSIETRKPMIRLSTTGFSTAMTEKGKILTQSPLDEPWMKNSVSALFFFSSTNCVCPLGTLDQHFFSPADLFYNGFQTSSKMFIYKKENLKSKVIFLFYL